jgi:hypothetical protein
MFQQIYTDFGCLLTASRMPDIVLHKMRRIFFTNATTTRVTTQLLGVGRSRG